MDCSIPSLFEVFGGICVLSYCFLGFPVGVGAFVIGLGQISSFFSLYHPFWLHHFLALFRRPILIFYYTLFWVRITGDGSTPEMSIWSFLLIQSGFKMVYQSKIKFLFCMSIIWWVSLLIDNRSPSAYVDRFYDWRRLLRSVLRASNFSLFKTDNFIALLHYPWLFQPVLTLLGRDILIFYNTLFW